MTPLFKLWMRWLRNPILRKKNKDGKGEEFTKRFFEFIDMKYVHPRLKIELMEEHGLSEELAERASNYVSSEDHQRRSGQCFQGI